MDQVEADSRTLADLIGAEAPFAIERALSLAISICDAVEERHRQGYFSGSLSPMDILVSRSDSQNDLAVRINGGMHSSLPRVGNLESRAHHAAPETADEIDAASDVYCIGTILFEMLVGTPPFQDLSAEAVIIRQLLERPHPPRDLRPEIPGRLEFILLRTLERDKSLRQQTVVRLKQELASVLREMKADPNVATGAGLSSFEPGTAGQVTSLGVSMEEAADTVSTPLRGRFRPIVWIVVGLVLFVCALPFSWILFRTRAPGPLAVPTASPASTMPVPARPDSTTSTGTTFSLALLVVAGVVILLIVYRRRGKPSPPELLPINGQSGPHAVHKDSDDTFTSQQFEIPAASAERAITLERRTALITDGDAPTVIEPQNLASTESLAGKHCPFCGAAFPGSQQFCSRDGHRLEPADRPSFRAAETEEIEPFDIGSYHCFERLGTGGMAVVYKARHIHLDRLSAVKVLLPETAVLPDAVNLFRREARLASSINHPNSVLIYDYGEFSTRLFYLAMEFIPGKSLAEVIDLDGEGTRTLPIPRALHITRQICDVLYAAHQVGIVHRDLKPQNVMICERTGQPDLVKVVDFGIARSLTHSSEFHSSPGVIMGTPAYMSPEQAMGATDLDGRSDIYSLGLVIYQMLSGELPFPTHGLSPIQVVMQRAFLKTTPAPLSVSRPDLSIPLALDQVLQRALEVDRNRRTASAARFIEELEQAARATDS